MRITKQDLQHRVNYINWLTNIPQVFIERGEIQPGNFHLDIANGGVALCRTSLTTTGESNILPRTNKRDLYNRLNAFIKGLEFGQGGQ